MDSNPQDFYGFSFFLSRVARSEGNKKAEREG